MRLVSLAALAGLASTLAAAAPQAIATCQMINQPGSYVVDKNLTAAGDCIVIAADFVTLDLDGFVITGNGKSGAGVSELRGQPFRGITVRNGTITGFAQAILLTKSTGATVERIHATANADHAISLGDMATVRSSVAIANGHDGIRVGQRGLVTGSNSEENGGAGIRVDMGGNVIGNTVGRNKISGISTVEGASVINNVSRNNSSYGIFMDCPGLAMGNATSNNLAGNFFDVSGGCVVETHNSTL
jgi:hypothetical protein